MVISFGPFRPLGSHPIMDPEQIFLFKLEDLRARCEQPPAASDPREYTVLMAAPLLRDLLISSPPLAHRVNRDHRLKLSFRCVPLESLTAKGLPEPEFHTAALGFAMADLAAPEFVQELPLEAFLGAPVAFLQGREISVRDLIDYVANAAGGVHFGSKDKRRRSTVDEFNNWVRLNGYQPALYTLMAIGQVTVAALEPLAGAVRTELDA